MTLHVCVSLVSVFVFCLSLCSRVSERFFDGLSLYLCVSRECLIVSVCHCVCYSLCLYVHFFSLSLFLYFSLSLNLSLSLSLSLFVSEPVCLKAVCL